MIGAMAGSATSPTGWDALRAAEWAAARAAFEADLAGKETAAGLDGLARARWWLSDLPGAIEAWERAYATYRRGGQDEPAAHVAVLLSREHAEGMGNDALANGWLARARDLLDGYPDSIEWGWVALVESEQAVYPTSALEHAEQALAVARQTRDSDLELAALGRAGLAEIALGRIEAGVTLFDEGMAASAAGEAADLRTLGDLYCAANLAAEITLDMSRFEQWTGVVMGFMERTGHPDLLTFCGTCCAEVCRAAGRWEDGEGWLTRTLSQLERSGQKARCVHPATRLASFRVAQGRLEEADQLLRGYEDLPEAVQAMVALHLARGQTALAAARLHRRLNEIGRDNLATVPLLAQLVEVQLAQPDLGGAAETAEALAAIAARSGHVRAQAEAELALGSVWAVSTWTAVWDCSYGSGCRMPRVGCTSRWPGPWPKPTRTRRPPSPIGTSPPTRPSRNPRFQLGISGSSDPCASFPCHARLGCHQRRRGTWPRRMSSGTDAGRRGGTRSYDSRGPAERRPRSSTTCWRPPEPPGVGRPAAARDHPAAHPDGATRPGGRRGRVPQHRVRRQGRPMVGPVGGHRGHAP
jgi:hypothetical protein